MSQAELSGSSRLVKPSISRLATWPGSGAFCQLSIGANSHASGPSVPPARRCLTYATVSRQTVPTAPASRPATTAASGVSGCFPVFMASSDRCAVGGMPGKVDRIRSAQLPAAIAAGCASWWPRGGWVDVVERERRGGVAAELLRPSAALGHLHRREAHRAALCVLSPATRAGLGASFMARPAFHLVSCLRATPGQQRYQPAGSCQVSRSGSSRSASLGPQLPLAYGWTGTL